MEVNEERFRLMNEGFGGIKDLLLMGRDNDFINRFNRSGKTYSQGNVALARTSIFCRATCFWINDSVDSIFNCFT